MWRFINEEKIFIFIHDLEFRCVEAKVDRWSLNFIFIFIIIFFSPTLVALTLKNYFWTIALFALVVAPSKR